MLSLDLTKFEAAAKKKVRSHDNCTVLDLDPESVGSTVYPRMIEVRPPGDDGPRQFARWDGGLNLAVNDKVLCKEFDNAVWVVEAMGGDSSGAGLARVSDVWESGFGAVALAADASGNLTLNGTRTLTIPTDLIHAGDTDTLIGFDTNIITAAAGGLTILTLENREAVIVDVAETKWVDVPLIDAGSEGSHFRDNDSSYPAGWTETDAAELTNTNTLYSFWYLQGSSSETSWDYRKQTSTDLEVDIGAGQAAIFLWGPIIFKDDTYTADIDYYFGVYRDNAGIDVDTFARVHLQWDSAGSQWRIRGELKDSTSGTQTNGAWFVFSTPIDSAFFVATGVVNNASKTAANYYSLVNVASTSIIANNWMTTLQFANPVTALTWGNIWLRTHQTRGAGSRDRLLVGAVDRLS